MWGWLRVAPARLLPGQAAGPHASITAGGYAWEAGRATTGSPLFALAYLLGYPV